MAKVQGATFVASGLWPLVHYASFEAVTGRKREPWLVKTVGLLIATIGGAMLVGARAKERRTVRALGVGTSLALGSISWTHAASGRVSPVYFVDAVLESSFVTAWALALGKRWIPSHRG